MATMKIIVVLAAAFLFVNAEEAPKADEKADAKTVQYSYSYVSKPVVTHQVVTHTITQQVGSTTHHVVQKPAHTSPIRPRPLPVVRLVAYVVNKKINCWNGCHAKGGKCEKVCGKGGYCCRKGWKGCVSDMSKVATPNYHTCIRYRASPPKPRLVAYVVDKKINCWNGCHAKGGKCEKVCGKGGYCCRKGWKGCPSAMTNVATPNYHTCIRYRGFVSPPKPPQCKVELFQHSNYGGLKNEYTGDASRVKRNDDMSSLKVGGGCCVVIYEHYNYGGRSQKYCKATKFVGGWWNDKVSSIKVVKGPLRGGCSAELFQHSNYGGIKNVYRGDAARVKRNDDMSSLKVGGGCCVVIYEHYNYGGKSQKYCGDTKFVGGWWNDKVSSVKVVKAAYKDEVEQVERDEEAAEDEDEDEEEVEDEDEEE